MTRSRFSSIVVLALFALPGCSSDLDVGGDDASSHGDAGASSIGGSASGQGGSAAGHAGSSGHGGSSLGGNAGHATAGSSGVSGHAGASGSTGGHGANGGIGGTAGASGANAGSGGASGDGGASNGGKSGSAGTSGGGSNGGGSGTGGDAGNAGDGGASVAGHAGDGGSGATGGAGVGASAGDAGEGGVGGDAGASGAAGDGGVGGIASGGASGASGAASGGMSAGGNSGAAGSGGDSIGGASGASGSANGGASTGGTAGASGSANGGASGSGASAGSAGIGGGAGAGGSGICAPSGVVPTGTLCAGTLVFTTSLLTTTSPPYALATGDFDCDHHQDLVEIPFSAKNFSTPVETYRGLGDGTFAAPLTSNPSGMNLPMSVGEGDLDGDGLPDLGLAALYPGGGMLTALVRSKGDGTFAETFDQGFSSNPYFIDNANPDAAALGLFSEDGKLDLVVASANSINGGFLTILEGKTNTTLNPPKSFANPAPPPSGMVVGDFLEDGHLDVVTANVSSNVASFTVFTGDGTGSFTAKVTGLVGNGPEGIASGDWNGDHHLDLAFSMGNNALGKGNVVSIALGKGDGTFGAPNLQPIGTTSGQTLVSGDVTGDGVLDLVLVRTNAMLNGNVVTILAGVGDGTFGEPVDYDAMTAPIGPYVYGPRSLALADFDGDGNLDIALANPNDTTITVFRRTGCLP